MKLMVSFLSFIIVVTGTLPLWLNLTSVAYSSILAVVALIVIVLTFINNRLFGFERIFLLAQGAALIVMAALPFIHNFLPFIPRTGLWYSAIILFIGAFGLIYGLMGKG